MAWLQANWYLIIPWAGAIAGWLIGRRAKVARPIVAGVVGFVLGAAIVLVIDLLPAG